MASVLIVGESSVTVSSQIVGFDQFSSGFVSKEVTPLREVLERGGHEVAWMPAHEAQEDFPVHLGGLSNVDVLILSDIGANTLLLHPDAYMRGKPTPNRLKLIRDWTFGGGALAMCGGYLSFAGFGGAAFYYGTPVEEALPVRVAAHDDRVETPEGAYAQLLKPNHPILEGIGGGWPPLLGYNRTEPTSGSSILATIDGDPLLVVGEPEKGRVLAWTSDIGPHWCPQVFWGWEGYGSLWNQAVDWLAG